MKFEEGFLINRPVAAMANDALVLLYDWGRVARGGINCINDETISRHCDSNSSYYPAPGNEKEFPVKPHINISASSIDRL